MVELGIWEQTVHEKERRGAGRHRCANGSGSDGGASGPGGLRRAGRLCSRREAEKRVPGLHKVCVMAVPVAPGRRHWLPHRPSGVI